MQYWRPLAPLGYMAALFLLSSVPGDLSPETPLGRVFHWVAPNLQNLLHIPLYAGLTLSWLWALTSRPWAFSTKLTLALLLSMAWGVLDEFHQSGVPGRYGSFTDVGLNLLGAALATLWASRHSERWK